MKKTMMYLPEELHRNLKRLAVERDTSVTALLREAVVALIEEERDDVEGAVRALEEFRQDPSSAISLEDYDKRRRSR